MNWLGKILRHGKQTTYRYIVFIAAVVLTSSIWANPVLDNVAAGNVSIQQSPNSTVINQSSQKAIINWQSFNIGASEATHFQQPAGGIALNRISPTQGASSIYGRLTATGQIILINPAGIFFGPNAYVNVGGLIASTANISDQNFLNGNYIFSNVDGYNGSIINQGQIIAANHGLVALVGNKISNEGLIQANLGTVVLASGKAFTMSFAGNDLINFTIDQKAGAGGGVSNTGSVIANGGTIVVSAKAAQNVLDNVINMDGVMMARSFGEKDGEIILSGDDDAGVIKVGGTIDVSGKGVNEKGGNVKVTGYNILLDSPTVIDASGSAGGGNIYIGGNYLGQGPLPNAHATVMAPGARLIADAIQSGNGGEVILWSNALTKTYGSISARGGNTGGNGGFIETSSKGQLDVNGLTVDTRAPYGETGLWLLDPSNVTIQNNVVNVGGSFDGGDPNTFNPDASGTSIVSIALLKQALGDGGIGGSNVYITTVSAAPGPGGNLSLIDPLSWNSAYNLTLFSTSLININAPITTNAGLSLKSQMDININSAITAGSLTLDANNNINASAAINVNNFILAQGTWSQTAASAVLLPAFTVTNNFQVTSGGASFFRAVGSGSDYHIVDVFGLQGINSNTTTLGYNYTLDNNIDASSTSNWNSGAGFVPIGSTSTPFTGTLDGQNFTISSLYINRSGTSHIGLFGEIGTGAAVSNLKLNTTILGSGSNFVGGLAGVNNGGIFNVHTSGSVNASGSVGGLVGVNNAVITESTNASVVSANSNVGGLVGANSATGSITDSGNSGAVSGFVSDLGGLVGANSGIVARTYNTGNVAGPATNLGGLVGANGGAITNSFNAGRVNANFGPAGGLVGQNTATGTIGSSYSIGIVNGSGLVGSNLNSPAAITNSYWDMEFSGAATSAGGFGRTTTQMKQASNYSGWDIPGTWGVIEGVSYPYFSAIYGLTPRVISGGSNASANQTVQLAVNGSNFASTQTGANGAYYFLFGNGLIADSSVLLAYLTSGGVSNAITVAPTAGNSVTGLNLNSNTITVGDNNLNSLSNVALQIAKGSLSSNILYTVGASNAILLNNNIGFITTPTTLYTIDGASFGANGGAADIIFNGRVSANFGSLVSMFQNGSGRIIFNSTLDGPSGLNITANNDVTIGNEAGGISPFANLNVTVGTGNINLYHSVTSMGDIKFSGQSILFADAELSALGTIELDEVDSDYNILSPTNLAFSFSATANTVKYHKMIGRNPLWTLPWDMITNAPTIEIAAPSIYSSSSQVYNGAVVLKNDVNLYVESSPILQNIVFNSTINSDGTARALNMVYLNELILKGDIGTAVGGALRSFTAESATGGTIIFDGAANLITTQDQTFTDNLELNNNVVFQAGGNVFFNKNIASTGATQFTINNTGTLSYIDGVISGAMGLVKEGVGSLDLQKANTYSGQTTINNGMLTVNNAQALGTGASGTTIAANGILNINNLTLDSGENLTIGGGLLTSSGANAGVLGNIQLTADSRFGGTGIFTLQGMINGGFIFNKESSNTIVLTNSNSYGSTAINDGTLQVNNQFGLGAGSVTVNTNGVLALNSPLPINNAITLAGGTLSGIAANNGVLGAITLTDNSTITTDNNLTVNTITGPHQLNLNGGGTITLAGVVGGTPLSSITANAQLILTNGNITTSGSQSYLNKITLFNNANITSNGAGVMLFAGINRDATARDLTITTGGAINLAGAIGSGANNWLGTITLNSPGITTIGNTMIATSLITDAGGTTAINTPSIVTSGAQDYHDTVDFGSGAKMVKSGSGLINFHGNVTSSGAALTLQDNTVASTGKVTFHGNVNLANLITFGGAANYAVELFGASNTFSNQVTFNNTGGVTLGNNFGDTFNFANGLISTASTTRLSGDINTTNSNVNLGQVIVDNSSNVNTSGGNITVGAIDDSSVGGHSLTLNAGIGDIALQGVVGGVQLSGLTASGRNVTADQNVSVVNNINLSASNSLSFAGLLKSGLNVALTGGTINATGVGAIDAIALTTSGVGGTTLNGANTVTQFNATNSGSGDISLVNTGGLNITGVNQTGGNLNINNNGSITQSVSNIFVSGNSSFIVGGHAIILSNPLNTFGGVVTLSNSGANNVTLASNSLLTLGASSVGNGSLSLSGVGIAQTGAITQAAGAGNVTIHAGAGAINLNNVNNDFTGIVSLYNSGANDVTFNNTSSDVAGLRLGNSILGSGITHVTNTGAITTTDNIVTTGGDVNLTTLSPDTNARRLFIDAGSGIITNGGSIALNAANDINHSTTDALKIHGAIDTGPGIGGTVIYGGGTEFAPSAYNLGAGSIYLQGNGQDFVVASGPITLMVSSNTGFAVDRYVIVYGNILTTSGANLTLAGNSTNTGIGGVIIKSGGSIVSDGDITFIGTTLAGLVGADQDAGIQIESGATVSAKGAINLLLNQGDKKIVINSDLVSTAGGSINVVNAGSGGIDLGANVSSAGGAVNFLGPVNLTSNVALNSGSGISNDITFNNVVNGAGQTLTLQNAGSANGNVIFNDNVNLGALIAANQAYSITFNGTANNFAATVDLQNTAATTLGHQASDVFNFNGGLTRTNGVTNVNSQINSNGALLSFADVNVTGDSIFNAGSGDVVLGGAVSASGAGNLDITATNINVNGGSVAINGNQNYHGNVILGANTNFAISGAGAKAITFDNGIAGNMNATFNGNADSNAFNFNGPLALNDITVSGSASSANNNLSVNSGNNQNWVVSNTNSGNITGVTSGNFTFDHIQNLTGGSNEDSFTIAGGTLSGSIAGGGGNNILVADNVANQWAISGVDSGTVTGVAGGFSAIQNLTGGNQTNYFTFQTGGRLSGFLFGGGLNNDILNTLDFASYNAPVKIVLSTIADGVVSDPVQPLMAGYFSINNLVSNPGVENTIVLPDKANQIVVTDAAKGYIGDPTYFSGFTSFDSISGLDTVTFSSDPTFNGANSVTVNGITMYFFNFPNFGRIFLDVSQIIQQPDSNSDSNGPQQVTPSWVYASQGVSQNLDDVSKQVSKEIDAELNKRVVNPYCYSGS